MSLVSGRRRLDLLLSGCFTRPWRDVAKMNVHAAGDVRSRMASTMLADQSEMRRFVTTGRDLGIGNTEATWAATLVGQPALRQRLASIRRLWLTAE